ncbi:MAG: hypothetical protein H7145_17545 [Akkermansiaceae bacterium]|nr:hypothetical protein [Armatimonadota bacterium]
MSDATRARLDSTGRSLLRLHKSILDAERAEYEGLYGRVNAGQMLQLLLNDPWFAWLRVLSEFIVQVDEMAESKEPVPRADADALLQQIRTTIQPREGAEGFGGKYHNALQHNPDAVLLHAEVSRLLAADA